jgi:hypothetical protein
VGLAIVSIGNMKDFAIAACIERFGGEIVELDRAELTPMFLETDCIMLLRYSLRDCYITV